MVSYFYFIYIIIYKLFYILLYIIYYIYYFFSKWYTNDDFLWFPKQFSLCVIIEYGFMVSYFLETRQHLNISYDYEYNVKM